MHAKPDPAALVAAAISGMRFEDLPAPTVERVKRLVLDSLAVAMAGRGCREVNALVALAADWGGHAQSALLGTALRVPAPAAALVNGTMIQALDFDDTHDPTSAHTASTVLAAALAIAQARGRGGRELIVAAAAGVDLAVRMGLASERNFGWTSTAVYGAFGAAAAASHLLRLGAQETRHALGIVLSQAAGTSQTALEQPLSKHVQSGFAAQAGVLAALLAEQGITGVASVFEGRYGFFNLYKEGRYRIEPLLTGWGTRFEVDQLSLKPFPACRATHGPIEAALSLAAPDVRAEQITGVNVEVPRIAFDLAGRPFGPGCDSMLAAQFSIPYTVATALLRGGVSLPHFRAESIGDPIVRALAQRVTVAVGDSGDFTPARVEVRLADGTIRSAVVTSLKGSPGAPLTDAELLAKVRDCLAFAPAGCAGVDAAQLRERVARLDAMARASELLDGLASAARALPAPGAILEERP